MPYVPSWERRAKQEGIREGKLDTARKLIKRGISIEIIAASIQLSHRRNRETGNND